MRWHGFLSIAKKFANNKINFNTAIRPEWPAGTQSHTYGENATCIEIAAL